ncbi:MAG TPA: efflux RND transporter permease subunit [Acidobacteriota bacterium]|nr:efflux RND transporter permease subunit [Acidobacteriota bacterium]
MKLSEYSVLRPVTVLMATVSILVLGFISLQRLPLTLLPEFSSDGLNVHVDYPSSSPEEVERNISRPLEEVLSTLDNLDSIQSFSRSNGSRIRLEFTPDTNMDLVAMDVRDRIDQVRGDLPEDVERIQLRRWQSSDIPVFRFDLAWDGEADEFYNVTQDIILRQLERIDGVANVSLRGLATKQILVDVDPEMMETFGVDIFNVQQALRLSNVNISGGWVYDGGKKLSLRTVGEFNEIDQIRDLPLPGSRVILSDVAEVRYDFPEQEEFSRLNKKDSVSVRINKASTANVVAVCADIRRELAALREMPQLKDKLSMHVISDQSEGILKSLNDLRDAGVFGGLLAAGVLFLFLRKFRSTIIISLAIPVSVVFTFAFMYLLRTFFGSTITLNIISLMGLMVAVGMLVDASVVVLENIFRYKQDKGYETIKAAIKGSTEVGTAVLASTATTVVVFVGFLFQGGSGMGRFTRDFGIAVSVALVASLVVALTLIPMLAGRFFTGREKEKSRVMQRITEAYGNLMRFMLRFRFIALILMALIGWSSYELLTSIDRQLMPSVSERRLRLDIFMERSFSLDEISAVFARVEDLILENKEELEVESVSSDFDDRTPSQGFYEGDMEVYLREEGDITPAQQLQERLRAMLPDIPGVEFRFGRSRHFGGGAEMGVEVELRGDDPQVLATYAEVVKQRLQTVPGVRDVQSTLETGDDEVHLEVDRQRAEQLGISAQRVARSVASALGTRAATRYKSDSGEVDVILQYEDGNKLGLQELNNTSFENTRGEMVPLYSVVDYSYAKGPVSIEREDRRSVLEVVANTEKGASSFMLTGQIQRAMEGLTLPAGYSWGMGRGWRDFRQEEEQSFFAILLAIVFMYIIMASLFEHFIQPLTIMLCVPFSLIGVAGLFYLTETTLNRNAYLGILVLFGIVVNNGIILINHINVLNRQGMSLREAIVQGGMDRLRPILMTAATSLFGLAPLTLPFLLPEYFPEVGERGRMWAPVSLAVLGGLTTSTFLTLIILPTVHSYMEDLTAAVVRFFAWLGRLPEMLRPGTQSP